MWIQSQWVLVWRLDFLQIMRPSLYLVVPAGIEAGDFRKRT
jgi:hypothetical protein